MLNASNSAPSQQTAIAVIAGADAGHLPPDKSGAGQSSARRIRNCFSGRETWALGDQAMVSGTNFLTSIVIARVIGIQAFGAFTLAWMAVLFVNLFQSALIVSPMMSLYPKVDKNQVSSYLGALLVCEGIFASCSACAVQVVCYFGAKYFHRPDFQSLRGGLSAATFCYLAQDLLRRYLFTVRKSACAFWIDVLSYPPQVIIIAVAARTYRLSTGGVLWIIALTSACGIIVCFFYLERATFVFLDVKRFAGRHWTMSRWLILSVVLDWISSNLFFVVAPVYFGAAAAGAVRASQNLVGICHIWFMGLENVVPAEASHRLHEHGLKAAASYLGDITVRWGGGNCVFYGTRLHCSRAASASHLWPAI